MDIVQLLKEKAGIRLDIGCGGSKQPGFVGMDMRELPGVDIVHNWNDYPWPLPDGICTTVLASHVVEHVNPADGGFLRWMDELWRICQVDGEVAISTPHGYSMGYLQDPTHCNPCCEATWGYFTPAHPFWTIYRPKPWRVKMLTWDPTRNIEVILVKMAEEDNGDAES